MRPPAKQAENAGRRCASSSSSTRFNEAACKTGGKQCVEAAQCDREIASMRPPAKQAENTDPADDAARPASLQ